MKRYIVISFLIIAGFLLSGCGLVNSSLNYTPPKSFNAKNIITTKIIKKNYNKAWSELVNNLSDTSFVINNINKDSGFINISFSVSDPKKYIDCGRWVGYFKNLVRDEHYDFSGAESASFIASAGNTLVTVVSSKTLSGRINILLQKLDKNKLRMKVNVKYILSGTNKNTFLYPAKIDYINWVINFNSKEKGKVNMGQTQCQSKGVLESELLEYIN